MLLHLVAQSLDGSQAHGIFLSGDDDPGRRHLCEGVVDVFDVFTAEVMMVGECERREVSGEG